MQDGVGGDAAGEVDARPAKRTRRPSVRFHQPYYENPGHLKLQRQWKPIKRRSEGAKKPRVFRTAHAKGKKSDGASESSEGEKVGNFNLDGDDDVAIGNWKNINASNGDRDFKRNRVNPCGSKKFISAKSPLREDKENQGFTLSSDGESGKLGEGNEEEEVDDDEEEGEEEGEEEVEEDAEGNNNNLVVENSVPSSPNCSFSNDDVNEKSSDDNENVGANQGSEKQRGLKNRRNSNETGGYARTRGGDRNSNGVRAWLNELGLEKYAPLFEVHEVDDEVLAHLTLEDLKDMGINAVGSRRKMYSSIQKLGKGFM